MVGFGGIIQSNSVTGYWGAGLLTLGLNPVGNRVKAQMSDVIERENSQVHNAFRYICQRLAYTITVSSEHAALYL